MTRDEFDEKLNALVLESDLTIRDVLPGLGGAITAVLRQIPTPAVRAYHALYLIGVLIDEVLDHKVSESRAHAEAAHAPENLQSP